MRTVLAIGFLVIAGCAPASAQSIVGRWLHNGTTATGAPFTTQLVFQPNGQYGMQMGISTPTGIGSGITRCAGSYRADGSFVRISSQQCQTCPPGIGCSPIPPQSGDFSSQYRVTGNTLELGGDRFTRQ